MLTNPVTSSVVPSSAKAPNRRINCLILNNINNNIVIGDIVEAFLLIHLFKLENLHQIIGYKHDFVLPVACQRLTIKSTVLRPATENDQKNLRSTVGCETFESTLFF